MGTSIPADVGHVRDWMSREPVTASPDQQARQVAGLMRVRGIRHVLVVDGGRLAGVVSHRDLRRLEPEAPLPADSPVASLMADNPVTVSPDVPLTVAARAMLEHRIGALPVVEDDRVVGILTRSDVLEALLAWAESRAAASREGGG
jgi:acetoin utilization protein AcuB